VSLVVGGYGPISWAADRVGLPPPGACAVMWREFMRLGYLRHVLRDQPTMATAALSALLAGAPALITADSASRGSDPSAGGTHHRTLRWLRGRG